MPKITLSDEAIAALTEAANTGRIERQAARDLLNEWEEALDSEISPPPRGPGRRPTGFEEFFTPEAKGAAREYAQAVEAGIVDDKSPAMTILRTFEISESTWSAWRREIPKVEWQAAVIALRHAEPCPAALITKRMRAIGGKFSQRELRGRRLYAPGDDRQARLDSQRRSRASVSKPRHTKRH